MGWVEVRHNDGGDPRYRAKYRDARGRKQTAGTFDSEEKAQKEASLAEAKALEGRGGPTAKGRQKFKKYVLETWFPNHRLELRSRENYGIYLDKHIVPYFANMKMNAIWNGDIRSFVTDLEDKKVPASSIEYCLTILSAIFTTALNDQVVFFHPCKGVSAPERAKKIRQIITPEEFDVFYEELADDLWRLLAETDIETGLRWGELTELRPRDFNFTTCVIEVTRVVIELMRKYHPEGRRFLVKEYPKDGEHRQVSFSGALGEKIQAFIEERGIGGDDLLFEMPPFEVPTPLLRVVPDPDGLGPVEPGSRYMHGTISAYQGARCRCEHCRGAFAAYRAERRALGKDRKKGRDGKPVQRRVRAVDTDGHIPRNWFRSNVWIPARDTAKLNQRVTPHSMRHAHASWLLAGGADLAQVKERLGHGSVRTTEKYINYRELHQTGVFAQVA
jgi:integrase